VSQEHRRQYANKQNEMGERQNTAVCSFDMRSPRINAFNIHDQLCLQEEDIRMIQISGPLRQVFIKFVTAERIQSIIPNILGQKEYRHENGELSIVKLELAGMIVRRVRLAGLPPEVKESVLRDAILQYGDVKTFRRNNGQPNIDTRYRME